MSTAALLAVALLVILVAGALLFPLVSLWIQASFSGVPVSLSSLIGMRLRSVDPRVVVFSSIRCEKAGLHVTPQMLETHFLCGGRVQNVVTAMILAKKGSVPLGWDTATAIDLAGRDILEAVEGSIKPRTVLCGRGNPPVIEVQAGDGALLRLTVEVICRVNVNRLVGGATLEVLRQRICDAAGDFVNAAPEADPLLANPSIIERHLSLAGLDDGAALTVTGYRVKASRVQR